MRSIPRTVGFGLVALAVALPGALGACSDDDDGEGTITELCSLVGDRTSFKAVFDDFDPTDTERSLEQLRDARVRLGDLHAAAPDEIRPALSTEIDYVDRLIEALEAVAPDDATAAVNAVNALSEQAAAVNVANGELEAFYARSCETTTTATPAPSAAP